MTVSHSHSVVQYYEHPGRVNSSVLICNSFVFVTENNLLILDLTPDLFRPTANYKTIQNALSCSSKKPFEDMNFKYINFKKSVGFNEHNLKILPDIHEWYLVYMGNHSNIIYLKRENGKFNQRMSDIPQNWFSIVSRDPRFNLNNPNSFEYENRILNYCREKERLVQIKNFVLTHILNHDNYMQSNMMESNDEVKVYGTICCHISNVLTFWSTTSSTKFTGSTESIFLSEFKFHFTPIKHMKWFQISNELFWLMVFLVNGQIYVHEICNYPDIENTFILWSNEDFACVKNIWIENISNDQCLIFVTKMSYLLIILYSLIEKKILSTKKQIIPTTLIAGLTYVSEKKLLIIVTDIGKFVYIKCTIIDSKLTYTCEIINNNFSDEQVKNNFTCTSVVFSKNHCLCVLVLECNLARLRKKYGNNLKNKLIFCTISGNLMDAEEKILSINDCNYFNVLDCIETLRINKINEKSNELYQLDRKLLDKCSIQYLKLAYWKIAFINKKNEHKGILQELQMLLHIRYLNSHFSTKQKEIDDSEKYYCCSMLSYYLNKLPSEYAQVKTDATNLINSFKNAKHTYFCITCERMLLTFTDFKMFKCEFGHKELRCPVTLGPLGMPSLVCSMCCTMANIKAKNQSCVWCFGKYVTNKLLF